MNPNPNPNSNPNRIRIRIRRQRLGSMRPTRCLYPLFVCLALLGGRATPPAAAQSAATYCEDDAECARLANQASEMTAMGLLNDAQRTYDTAYQRVSDPKLLYERARVLHKLGRFVDAALCYRKYIEQGAGGNEKQRRKAEQYLDEALQQAQDAPTPRPQPASASPPPAPPPAALTPATPPSATTPAAPPTTAAAAPPVVLNAVAPPPPQPKPAGPPRPKKLWEKWWFWTAIGGGVVVTTVALGLGLGLASRPPDLTGATEFHPFGN
jgi:hypothetical protein